MSADDSKAAADDLVDFEDQEEEQEVAADAGATTDAKKGHYTGVHSSGFRDFMLKPELLRAITECGFELPSEVQHACIPQAVLGMDIICQGKAGMGKTAVFVLSTLHQLEAKEGEVSILVVAPTRELAFMISREYQRFAKYLEGVKVAAFYGGMPITENRKLLKTDPPNIVVATPGRLLALVREGTLNLDACKHFVIDEADQVLREVDMRSDVQKIFVKTPHEKQVMMFSATMPNEIRPVVRKFMQTPLEIYVDDETKLTLHGLQQFFVNVEENQKNSKLNDLLDALEFNQVIIFVSSPARASELGRLLQECCFPTMVIHGRMKQDQRIQRYQEFKAFKQRILVATDLFGRGIDIERVNIVINYDFPKSADQYMHRVGRAGRFGTKGLAISFINTDEEKTVLDEVQSRFDAKMKPLPDKIDTSTYMPTRA